MKRLMNILMIVLLAGALGREAVQAQPAEAAKPQPAMLPTVAVIEFQSDLAKPADSGRLIAEVLSARLDAAGGGTMVERKDIDKILSENKLTLSGLVSPDKAPQIGKMLGARLLVTGRIAASDAKIYVFYKVISVESSQVKGFFLSLPAATAFDEIAEKLADKAVESLPGMAAALIPPEQRGADPIAAFKQALDGKPLPRIAVCVTEQHIGPRVIDPAVETELKSILTRIGVKPTTITPELAQKLAVQVKEPLQLAALLPETDYLFFGEAFSESGGTLHGLTIGLARAELNVIDLKTGKAIYSGRATTRSPDLSENLAAKTALQKAGHELGLAAMTELLKQLPPAAKDAGR